MKFRHQHFYNTPDPEFDGIDNDSDGRVDEDIAPVPCTPTPTLPGDGLDNDCDGKFDEELADGIDNDLDGLVDEDLMSGDGRVITEPGFGEPIPFPILTPINGIDYGTAVGTSP